jgi:microcystin-dependent protein
MGFTRLPNSAITRGKVASQLLLRIVRKNFISHEDRILELEASSSFFPAGSTFLYGGSTAPAGFLICNGSVVLRATYANLFAIIGTTFNTGGEAGTEFRLPNSMGRAIIGTGTGDGLTARTIAGVGGEETVVLNGSDMGSHSHTVVDPGHVHYTSEECNSTPSGGSQILEGDRSRAGVAGPQQNGFTTGSRTTGISTVNAGSSAAHNNVQPFLELNYVIKT